MTKFITVSKIRATATEYNEDTGVETDVEIAVETMVNLETVRSICTRKDNAPGARIEFVNGTAFAVKESLSEIGAAIVAINAA